MAFRPLSSGALPDRLPSARLHPSVQPETWRQALALADEFIGRMRGDDGFSDDWTPCADALARHIDDARANIGRLG